MEATPTGEVGSAARESTAAARVSASSAREFAATAADEGMAAINIAASSAHVTATNITATIAITTAVAPTAAIAAAVVGAAIAPSAVVPGASTYEDATYEPVRAIVTVGGTGIGRITVVAVRADRRSRIGVGIRIDRGRVGRIGRVRPDSDAHRNLCVRCCSRRQNDAEYSQQRNVFE